MNNGLIPIELKHRERIIENNLKLTHLLGKGIRLRAFACLIDELCYLAVLAPSKLFQEPDSMKEIYQRLSRFYPNSPVLLLNEEEQGAGHYFGHPKGEKEIFEIMRQVKEQRLNPPAYCMLPAKGA